MDENIVRILASYGCKYMADDNKKMIEEIEAYVKKREEQLFIPTVMQAKPEKTLCNSCEEKNEIKNTFCWNCGTIMNDDE
ncbi:hypothetical protein [Mesonia sp. HuA40]|uniref:hypothetical protein n=1 Tax=Mesonia sp. HuA40 TaxID=2602761 RepID=UPI0011C96680|nr:hypothetical protein [Mesonia sp. HuA40]TXK73936.1 hypothetical protein FT993_03495 [Mesonia sp. HuA40]